MPVQHVFLCSFKPDVSTETIEERAQALIDLKEKCLSPEGKPYILRASGGKDDTDGSRAHGFQYAFVFEFANDEDRKYYLTKDPVHIDYVTKAKSMLSDMLVIDYTF